MATPIESILEKCDIYYKNNLISRESLLEDYLIFLDEIVNSENKKVGIALHTGSICFDVISVVALGIGCLTYNLTTNDDIIARLQPDEIVIFKGQRYRWKGIEKQNNSSYLSLEQYGSGKNGSCISYFPYEENKHLVRPYYGNSQKTDGRGVKKKDDKREQFLSFLLDTPITEVPAEINVSVVIVSEREHFSDIYKNVCIEYSEDKRIELQDILPASFFTSGGLEYQLGFNPTKAEPVIKVTRNLSEARDLVLDKHGNKTVGLLIFGSVIPLDSLSELTDLLRRRALKFAVVEATINSKFGDSAIGLYNYASVFACTKDYLIQNNKKIRFPNQFTTELSLQASRIIENQVDVIKIDGGIEPAKYKEIRNLLFTLKQSNMNEETKKDFISIALGILNLLNTSVFTMDQMEEAIQAEQVKNVVTSVWDRLQKLRELADSAESQTNLFLSIINLIEDEYRLMSSYSPKGEYLYNHLFEHRFSQIAVVLPKAYYIDILKFSTPFLATYQNIKLFTLNKFDSHSEYDEIIVVGDISNSKFDPLSCYSSKTTKVLLYNCEKSSFYARKKKIKGNEHKLNKKIGIKNSSIDREIKGEILEDNDEIAKFSELDDYVESFALIDISKLTRDFKENGGSNQTSEVTHIGQFVTGEKAFFSKYYEAVVFDPNKGSVTEKPVSDLKEEDILVFTIHNSYTQNIVDILYEKLLSMNRLSPVSSDSYKKSKYWKECLRDYKIRNSLSFRDLAEELRQKGSTVTETTVRSWIVEESHIIGPRRIESMKHIASVTGDSRLKSNSQEYFDACRQVRRERRKILNWMEQVINDKLKGIIPRNDETLEVIYDNFDRLSETKELEKILELDENLEVNINLINRPILEEEVQ